MGHRTESEAYTYLDTARQMRSAGRLPDAVEASCHGAAFVDSLMLSTPSNESLQLTSDLGIGPLTPEFSCERAT
jgi:hypothetical protein